MRRLLPVLALAVGGVVVYAGLPREVPAPAPVPPTLAAVDTPLPPPTENWLDEGAEKRNKSKRKEWFRQMHRAPPEVDWKAIERENGLRRTARRNALAGAPPPGDAARWVERGSDNQAGRMHVARHSWDHSTLYAGSSLGGLWRGERDGTGWQPLADGVYGGAHWLEVLPPAEDGGADVVVMATDGGIVHRSTDGGATWVPPEGLEDLWAVRRLLVTSDASWTLYAVVGEGSGYTLRRSTDGGASFEVIYDLGGFAGDLWTPRDGGDRLYLVAEDGLRISDDGGATWNLVSARPAGGNNAELVGSEAGGPTLWAAFGSSELWRSPDEGLTWERVAALSDYWGALNASPYDPDVFAWGGVEVHLTRDGGASWEIPNSWWEYYGDPANLLHADIMGIDVVLDADGAELWYVNTDGGLYRSDDRLVTTRNLSMQGLRVSQYYDVLTSSANPEHVAAGAQDQGYQITNGVAQAGEVYAFSQIISGDYGHLTSSDGSHDWVYSVYPGFILVQNGEDAPTLEYADFPSGESYVPWLPPIVADPDEPRAFFFPASRLYRYTRSRNGWSYTQYSEQSFARASGEYVSALAFSPLDSNRAYAATSHGRVFWSDDKGVTWTESANRGPDENWYYGQAIVASNVDKDTVYLGGSGYGVPAVYRSTDGGRTFEPWSEGIESTLVYSMAEARDGSGTLVVGTETTVYRRDRDSDAWYEVTGAQAPVTIYWSVEALHHEPTFRFGTYGRGIWDYQLEGDRCWPATDGDGDGADCALDCDDDDASVFPGATEACDGVDRNCDPTDVDEADGDGDGAPACGDCDDGDAARQPGAPETCGDGVDQDCDGQDLPCDDILPGDTDEEGEDPEAQGCGCATSPAPGAALVPLLAAGLLLRRRRRP